MRETPQQSTAKSAQNWAAQQERGNATALRLITWIALHLGRNISRWVLVPTVAYFFLSSSKARQASRQFLSKIPNQDSGAFTVFRHMYGFAAVTLDRLFFLNHQIELFDIHIEDKDNTALSSANKGVGLFLMGAHMGSFESVRSIARHHPDLKMVLLMYEENARNIKKLLEAINPSAQQEIIALGRPGAMLEVRDKLSKGALIGVLGDRTLDAQGNVEVSFLGQNAAFPLGPFRMAAMLRHPMYFMLGTYNGGNRYTVHLKLIMDFSTTVLDREQASLQALRKYVGLLESHCIQEPLNWFNFFDFWQNTISTP